MTGINHKQAQRYLRTAADGLLRENQRALLDVHLRECSSCRAEAGELNALEARLKKSFQERWDVNDGPSKSVMTTIQSRSRRIIMTNRINTALKTGAGLVALLVLGVLFNPVFKQLQEYSEQNNSIPGDTLSTPQPYNGLIAFTSQKNNNVGIYTMRADGSNLIKLTDNSANNYSPIWSPDGKRIAFTSDRTDQIDHTGNVDIFVMNSDGKELTQLTDTPGYDDFLAWSPDGQKILVQFNQGGHLSTDGQLIVMNSDGSNKIALTKETGPNTFLSWSRDGQKIVYQKYPPDPNINEQDAGIYIVDIDGTNSHKLATDIDMGAKKIQWQDSEHFLGVGFEQKPEEQPEWSLYWFSADGSLPLKISTYSTPIAAVFEKTYVVEGQNALLWYSIEGDHTLLSPPLSSWSFSEICKKPSDPYLEDTQHVISPDGKYVFVTIHCWEGLFWSYLESADGSEITQLTGMSTFNPSELKWSPDGEFISFTINSTNGETPSSSLYLLELGNILKDPSAKPVQLTADGGWSTGAVWQPQPKNDVVENVLTPAPPAFSLTVQEAEALAGFDVLEPSYLPEGYAFQGASYDPQTQKVALKYGNNPSLGVIYIYQQHEDFPSDPTLPSHATPAPIGDVIGEYFHGAWVYEPAGTTTPRWDRNADYYSLSWQKDGISLAVDFLGGETIPPIQLNELTAIAESMK
ncbi:MAG: PD40 domain-containing protein [Chloroflexi bacterium]|nr:PD40 domain-containing protein [Chloroflexota bacterium]